MRSIILLIFLTSCLTSKKVDKYLDKHPEFSAKDCADRYPVYVDTIVNYNYDTISVPDIKIIRDYQDRVIIKPKIKTIIKTVTITKENTAKAQYIQVVKTKDSLAFIKAVTNLSNQITQLKADVSNKETKIKVLRGERFKYWLIILLLTLLLIRKPISRLLTRV
jgi:hypothetical protein